jgi:regulator of protease activity HflC (stomatin/prohibitin superfamily)
VCGGAGFLVGCLFRLVLWRRRRRRKAATDGTKDELSRQKAVPERRAKKPVKSALERLEAERPLNCRMLGFLTLGICKFYAVPQGNALVVTAFGKYRRACEPGLRAMLSFWGLYQRPYKDMPLVQRKDNTNPYENEIVFTSDGARCKLDVMVCYRVVDAGKALFEVDDYETAVHNIVRAVLRNECAKQPARTLLASREQMAAKLRATLEKNLTPWGIKVRFVEIAYIDIPVQDRDDRLEGTPAK